MHPVLEAGASSLSFRRASRRLRPLAALGALLSMLSTYCHHVVGGTGAVAPSHPDGSPCNNPVQCNSFLCSSGQCVAPPDGAIEIDGDCSGGGTCVANATCQEGICVAGGPMACAQDNAPCMTSEDCCGGICTSGACGFGTTGAGGGTTTTPTCKPSGDSCIIDSDCCTGGCDQGSDTCSDTCGTQDTGCINDSDCCSDVCASGTMTCI